MASFEEQFEELEAVVAQLEEGNLNLEQSVSLFERGVLLSRGCKRILANAESRVQAVMEPESDGPVRTEEIAVGVEEDEDESEDEDE